MVGFAGFGLLVFYFALFYRPMRLLDRMLANIASEMPEALFFFDAIGRCIWANEPGIQLAEITNEDFESASKRLGELFENLKDYRSDWEVQEVIEDKTSVKYYQLENHTVTDNRGNPAGSFLNIRDNTEDQLALKVEKYNATHDKLTDLYTREHLYERIQEVLTASPDTEYLILFIDVNDFKIINDIFGNAFGDYVLKSIADWIRKVFAENCVFGRLSGDTFGVCIPKVQFNEKYLEYQLAHYIVNDGNAEYQVLIHVGVYEVLESGIDVSVMIDRAHMALSTIKNDYQIHVAHYDEDMRNKVVWEQKISTQVNEALETRQIRPYLQPVVDATGKVVGAEALVRWIHPTEGFLSPALFIPVFEWNGMIAEVDKYMWRSACEILAKWKQEGRNDIFISVNISPKDFYFIDVAEELKRIVSELDVDPARLRIEITETVMMTDIENRMKILSDLRESGFIVEMDDFGSGYSSLNLLKDMPVDVLKIDMGFLYKSKDENRAQTIVHNIIHMSEQLGITSLTEGVEEQVQYQMLSNMGCKYFQGYYFSKPIPVKDFEAFCFKGQV